MMKIRVLVKPNAKKNEVEFLSDGSYRVCVKAPPTEGKANAALLSTLAAFFKVPKSSVQILLGATAKRKLLKIG